MSKSRRFKGNGRNGEVGPTAGFGEVRVSCHTGQRESVNLGRDVALGHATPSLTHIHSSAGRRSLLAHARMPALGGQT